jgi:hypothetical protein
MKIAPRLVRVVASECGVLKKNCSAHFGFPSPCAGRIGRMGFFVGQVRKMILRLEQEQQPTIDNRQNYPAEIVNQLETLLAEGVSARQDPRCRNFYDIEHADRAFFIYHSPFTGTVVLLATWRLLESPFIRFDLVAEVV